MQMTPRLACALIGELQSGNRDFFDCLPGSQCSLVVPKCQHARDHDLLKRGETVHNAFFDRSYPEKGKQ